MGALERDREGNMVKLKERVENNPVVFFLGAILIGFLAGSGAYKAVLEISNQSTISKSTLDSLQQTIKTQDGQLNQLRSDVSDATKKLQGFSTQLDQERTENGKLQNEVSALRGQLGQKAIEMEDLTKKLQSAAVPRPTQRWLRLLGVEGLEGFNARIIIRVNGMAYSYPSQAVWSQVGLGISTEDFPLPVGENAYRVSFEILSLSEDAKFKQFQSQEVIHVDTWPYQGSYRIFGITTSEWGTVRGLPPSPREKNVAGRIFLRSVNLAATPDQG